MALNERPEVSKIALEGVKRIQNKHDVQLWAVTHCQEDYDLAKEYGRAVLVDQKTVGQKFNDGLRALLDSDLEFDYIVQSGDDDVMHPNHLEAMSTKIDLTKADVIGGSLMYFYDGETAYRMNYAPGSGIAMGAGRVISRKALDKSFPLWLGRINRGLDFNSQLRLKECGFDLVFQDTGMVVDLKIKGNIWGMESYMDKPECVEVDVKAIKYITGDEIFEMI